VDRDEDLVADDTCSVLNTVLNTMNNEFEQECLHEAVRLPNAYMICQSTDDHVPIHKHSIPGLPGPTKCPAQQVWAIGYIMKR